LASERATVSLILAGGRAPGRAPESIVNRLHQETVKVLNRSDIREKFVNVGAEVVGSSPQEFAAKIRAEIASMGKVIKDAGIRDE